MPLTVEGFTLDHYDRWEAERFRQFHIMAAERVLKAKVRQGFDREPVVITDGRPRADYRAVKLFGVIEFARRTGYAEAVIWALNQLWQLSPKGPAEGGHYRADHTPMINGEAIKGNLREALMKLKPGVDRVQIVNPRIYARKIEGATANQKTGRGARRPLSRQAPQGVYRLVHRQLVQRFGKTMFFDFKYVQLNTGAKVWGDQGGRYRKDGTRTFVKRVQRDQVYPALQFFLKN